MRGAVEATLTGTTACALLTQDAGGWTFGPDQVLTAVPTATFRLDGRDWTASLPLNPQGRKEDEATCRVELDLTASLPRLGVRFTEQRRVGRAVDGMLRHHEVMAGAELLDQAASLLLAKYSDPASAALGGLTLHRYGRLRERQDWIENLARDFAWIPDGRILLAALLMNDHDDPRTGPRPGAAAGRDRGPAALHRRHGPGHRPAAPLAGRRPQGRARANGSSAWRRTRASPTGTRSPLVTGREDQWS